MNPVVLQYGEKGYFRRAVFENGYPTKYTSLRSRSVPFSGSSLISDGCCGTVSIFDGLGGAEGVGQSLPERGGDGSAAASAGYWDSSVQSLPPEAGWLSRLSRPWDSSAQKRPLRSSDPGMPYTVEQVSSPTLSLSRTVTCLTRCRFQSHFIKGRS